MNGERSSAVEAPGDGGDLTPEEANYEFLVHALEELRLRLEVGKNPDNDALTGELQDAREARESAAALVVGKPALDMLVTTFGLNGFECDLVLFCMGFELDTRFTEAYGEPTAAAALAYLPDPHWGALLPQAPLRRWQILAVEEQVPLVRARLHLSEDVMTYLLGLPVRAVPSDVFVAPPEPATLLESQFGQAAAIARAVRATVEIEEQIPVVELYGAGVEERRVLARLVADLLRLRLEAVDAGDLPAPGPELERTLRAWTREAVLSPAALLLEVGEGEVEPINRDRVRRATGLVSTLLIVSGTPGLVGDLVRPVLRHDTPYPGAGERARVWAEALGRSIGRLSLPGAGPAASVDVGELAEQYTFGASAIESLCVAAESQVRTADGPGGAPAPLPLLLGAVHRSCRTRTRSHLDALAQRIELGSAEHLVLPDRERVQLNELEMHIRYGYQVNTQWGMGHHHAGTGVSALFAGPSGTGKTLAAAVLGDRLDLDVYRVELAAVMSKYIGETEKNLRQIFEAASAGGAILLFDEADALFGKRSEVKDSHDRYANLEVAYLLQKMEQARTPSILTTNLPDSIDPAFQRRLRFVIEFPFPDAPSRAEIWRRVFPPATPTEGLDPARLAALAVNGGMIRNIALRAAFLAAQAGTAVTMALVLEATRREFLKLRRDLPAAEVAGWA
jgi:hypothetical protein